MNSCQYCEIKFEPKAGTTGKYCSLKCASKANNKIKHLKAIEKYNKEPVSCKNCGSSLSFKLKNRNKFCSRSCAATYNNSRKDWNNIKTGPKPKHKIKSSTKPKLKKKPRSKSKIKTSSKIKPSKIVNPHTNVYLCKCKITGIEWYSQTWKSIHPSAVETKKLYRYQCRFKFSIRAYKEWFTEADSLIKTYGWYSPSNKKNNLSGCSRDHLYSVSDGFENKIDPMLISHPANCKIVPHRENQKKHSKSTITIEELMNRIKLFEDKIWSSERRLHPRD